eukprot:c19488_g1_i1.p1 GENE.c19488_g1_i1~~c19488_g1_i1.p1  ORF type:complete len:576 (+),score=179.61 c19488_g1_i1:35-1762(+)
MKKTNLFLFYILLGLSLLSFGTSAPSRNVNHQKDMSHFRLEENFFHLFNPKTYENTTLATEWENKAKQRMEKLISHQKKIDNDFEKKINPEISKNIFEHNSKTPFAVSSTATHKNKHETFTFPTSSSHSHLLSHQQVTPGIKLYTYIDRRKKLLELMKVGDKALFFASPITYSSGDTKHEYTPQADLWYFTGIESPNVIVLIEKLSEKNENKFSIYMPHREHQGLDSETMSTEFARSYYSAHEAYTCDMVEVDCSALLAYLDPVTYYGIPSMGGGTVYTIPSANPTLFDKVKAKVKSTFDFSLEKFSHQLRVYKSEEEIELLKKVWEITMEAHEWAMRLTQPNAHEAYIRAVTSFVLESHYSSHAYPPIVASGAHGRTLHYSVDNDILRDGELILMDVGGRRFGYCGDVSRTWPVNCKFTPDQKELYNLLIKAQNVVYLTASEWTKRSVTTRELISASSKFLCDNLKKLGVPADKCSAVTRHSASHPIGVDVHDASVLPEIVIREGFAFTIEPGIYFSDDSWVPKRFRQMALRIEDDCIATTRESKKQNVICPTAKYARSIKAIESICGSALMPE